MVELAFYFYTILILLASIGSGMIALSAYFVSRKRSFLYTAFFFIFYCLDVAFIFQFEFLSQNIVFSPDRFYAIDYPLLKIFLSLGALESVLLIICNYLDENRLLFKILPPVIYAIACTLIVVLMPEDNWRQWVFYATRQVFLLWCLLFAAYKYLTVKNSVFRLRLQRHKTLFFIVLGFILIITLEDALMILVWQPEVKGSLLLLYFSQRNFSENFLMLFFALITIRNSASMLRLRFHEPPHPKDNPAIQNHIDELLPSFCARNGLTERESVILGLILLDKDTQNIASELHLAKGTIKTHVHNILRKTKNDTRRELIKDFWRE